MEQSKQNRLPPIIVDYISKLSDPTVSMFNKEIYCQHLERIRDETDKAIMSFNVEKTKYKAARK